MDELVYKTIIHYFDILKKFGYCDYIKIMPIFVVMFIDDLINSEFAINLTNEDVKTIKKSIEVITNNNIIIRDGKEQ